ncbi:MAG: tRNA (adenosine(37)-N6)-threonylcarbamoyltransferase complex ATPase subunit type 1 TsaE [Caldisericia bacterium]
MKQKSVKIKTKSSKETIDIGKKIGKCLLPGDIVLISGELGVGKTTFIKGIAKGMNIDLNIKSPSFVIVSEYSGKYKLYHIDLYRVDGEEIDNLGLFEFLENGVVCIEWADKLKTRLNNIENIRINIETLNKERVIEIVLNGKDILKRCIALR